MVAIDEFINTYSNPDTRRNYRSGIQKFLAWKYKFQIAGSKATLIEREKFNVLADDYLSNEQNYSRDILDFIANCNIQGVPAKSIRNWTAILKEWLGGHNELPLNVSRIRRKLPKGGSIEQKLPTMDMVREIVIPAKFKTRFLIIFLISTGCRINEALSIRAQDITEKDGIGIVSLKGKHVKTKIPRTVYLTPECLALYKVWMSGKREEYLRSSDSRSSRFLTAPRKDTIFPFDDSTASYMLETALKHSNLLKYHEEQTIDGRKRKITHLHTFRAFFDTTAALNGMPDMIRYKIIGHKKFAMDERYVLPNNDVKEKEFRKIVPFLTVLDDVVKAAEVAKIKDDNIKLRETYDSQIKQLQVEMNIYKKALGEFVINRMQIESVEPQTKYVVF